MPRTFQEWFAAWEFGNKPWFAPIPWNTTTDFWDKPPLAFPWLNVSPAQSVIKQHIESNTKAPEQKKTEYTIVDVTNSYKKALESGKFTGMPEQEVFNNILRSYKSKGYTIAGVDIDEELWLKEPVEEVKEEWGIWEAISDFWQSIKPFKWPADVEGIWDTAWQLQMAWKMLTNLPWDTVQLWGEIVSLITNPVDTAKGVFSIWKWLLDKAFRTGAEITSWEQLEVWEEEEVVNAIWNALWKVATDPNELSRLIQENPADIMFSLQGAWSVLKNSKNAKIANIGKSLEERMNPITMQLQTGKAIWSTVKAGKNKLFPTKPLDDLLLEVSQGKKSDIPKFKEALSSIDVDDIDTYENLTNTFSSKIDELANKQDSLLPTDEIHSIDTLTTTVGNRTTNFVRNALDDLENVGTKENDLELLNKVDELQGKASLSVKDINDLARFYGGKFKQKSFNKMWDAKSSVSAARFENNRKGLKDISRDLLPDDTAKLIDSEMSNLFSARDLSQKMADKVDNLTKKVQPRNLVEKWFRWVADTLDYLTLWWPSAFLSRLLPSNVGLKTMNSIGIQERLAKNLKAIETATKKLETVTEASEQASIITKLAREMWITQEAINNFANKTKDSIWWALDDVADKVGARAKFMDDKGTGMSGKIDAPKKYDRTFNIQDRNDLEYLKRILWEEKLEDLKNGNKFYNTWRWTTYEEIVKWNIISKKPQSIQQELAWKVKEYIPKSKTFYHWTSLENSNNILKTWYKAWSKLPSETFRGGWYGKMQSSISFAETPKEANIFASLTKNGKIIESKLKDNAKVVTIDWIEDAIDLEDYIGYLKKNKIDAVYIWGGEKELVVINSKAVKPIKIYKQANKKKLAPSKNKIDDRVWAIAKFMDDKGTGMSGKIDDFWARNKDELINDFASKYENKESFIDDVMQKWKEPDNSKIDAEIEKLAIEDEKLLDRAYDISMGKIKATDLEKENLATRWLQIREEIKNLESLKVTVKDLIWDTYNPDSIRENLTKIYNQANK